VRRRGRIAGLALVVALATVLSGCVAWFRPAPVPTRTSTPVAEDVAPELEPFYRQFLVWQGCGEGLECATASAPLDWSDPAAASIELALVRAPATGTAQGSLLVNPGGPGASGFDFVRDSLDFAVSDRLREHYDIVGFDPRGVGRSSAVRCYDDPAVLDRFNYGIVPGQKGSPEWLAAVEQEVASFGQSCLEFTGPLLQFVDTTSAARDLDLLRAILGDETLTYLGYSYGTFLGATYAELYPDKVGRLVLDGALDPDTDGFDVTKAQAVGFESAFRAYLADCLGQDGCPFTGTVDAAEQRAHALLDQLAAHPLTGADGRELGESTMFAAVILPLYSQSNWPYLDQLFAEVTRGETETAFLLADSYNERNSDGTYSSNQTEAFTAINCLDYDDGPLDPATLAAEAAELASVAPVFGPPMSWGVGCEGWPFPPTRERGPIRAAGAAPILVVGTTNDPATPYQWAVNLSEELESGHLVTYHGEGHTAYNKSNSCVNDAVDSYFIDGTVPASDPQC